MTAKNHSRLIVRSVFRRLTQVSLTALTTAAILATATPCLGADGDPFIDGVRSFVPGDFAGFGQAAMPRIVLGRPHGAGSIEGSTHVVSLGVGGEIEVVFRDNVVFDGPGDDLVVYENAFHSGDESGPVFAELAFVQVSLDRVTWHEFPYDGDSGEGLAGREPVFTNSVNDIDPLAPEAGGDRFDIGELGLEFVRYVRLIDVAGAIPDPGDLVAPGSKGGFDLDAVGAVHSSLPATVTGTVSHAGQPVGRARVKLVPLGPGRKLKRRTGADGGFAFARVVPSGDYRVRARRMGLGVASEAIYLDLDQLAADVELPLGGR